MENPQTDASGTPCGARRRQRALSLQHARVRGWPHRLSADHRARVEADKELLALPRGLELAAPPNVAEALANVEVEGGGEVAVRVHFGRHALLNHRRRRLGLLPALLRGAAREGDGLLLGLVCDENLLAECDEHVLEVALRARNVLLRLDRS